MQNKASPLSSSHPAENPKHEAEAFLLRTAELLHRYGTPSYRLEGVMSKVAESLNVPSVFLYTPTALVVSLGSGADERTFLRRVDSGDIDISKVLAFDAVLENLEVGKISLSQAAECLETEANAAAPFGLPVSLLAAAIACGGISVIFGGNVIKGEGYESQCYVEPTIVKIDKDAEIVREETFAPILYLLEYDGDMITVSSIKRKEPRPHGGHGSSGPDLRRSD